jgi:internalin A
MVAALGGWKRLAKIAVVAAVVFIGARELGWALVRRQQAELQASVRQLISELGGHYYYDFQLSADAAEPLADDDNVHSHPHWLSNFLGKDFMHDVFYVSLARFQEYRKDGAVAAEQAGVDDSHITKIAQLTGLRWLAAPGTAISDEGVKAVARVPKLEKLWLSQTAISDKALGYLSCCPHLMHLSVEATPTTDLGLREIAKMSKLEVLSLSSPHISADGLTQLSKLSELKELYLDRLPVDERSLAAIAQLDQLQVVSLRLTPVTDAGVALLGRLPNLTRLMLDGTSVSDNALAVVNWPKLSELSVRGTRLTDAGLQRLAGCKRLQSIKLDGTACTLCGLHRLLVDQQSRDWETALSIAFDTAYDENKRVVSLDLSGVRLRDACIPYVAQLTELQWLAMPDSDLTDAGVQALVDAKLDKLTLLNINRSAVGDASLHRLAELKSLRNLHIAGTGITADAISVIGKRSPSLRIYTSDFGKISGRPQ